MDNVNVKKWFCEIDGYRYPKEAFPTLFPETDYFGQNRDENVLYKEYVGENLFNPFISFTVMQNKHPIKVIDLRHQVDYVFSKKIQLFEEFSTNTAETNARLIVILIRHGQNEMISDGNKII